MFLLIVDAVALSPTIVPKDMFPHGNRVHSRDCISAPFFSCFGTVADVLKSAQLKSLLHYCYALVIRKKVEIGIFIV